MSKHLSPMAHASSSSASTTTLTRQRGHTVTGITTIPSIERTRSPNSSETPSPTSASFSRKSKNNVQPIYISSPLPDYPSSRLSPYARSASPSPSFAQTRHHQRTPSNESLVPGDKTRAASWTRPSSKSPVTMPVQRELLPPPRDDFPNPSHTTQKKRSIRSLFASTLSPKPLVSSRSPSIRSPSSVRSPSATHSDDEDHDPSLLGVDLSNLCPPPMASPSFAVSPLPAPRPPHSASTSTSRRGSAVRSPSPMQILAQHPAQLVWDPVEETWLRAEEVPLPSPNPSMSSYGGYNSANQNVTHGLGGAHAGSVYVAGAGQSSTYRRSPTPPRLTRSAGHSPYLAPTTVSNPTPATSATSARHEVLMDVNALEPNQLHSEPPPCYVQSQLEEATRRQKDKEREERRLRDEAAVQAALERQRERERSRERAQQREREQSRERALLRERARSEEESAMHRQRELSRDRAIQREHDSELGRQREAAQDFSRELARRDRQRAEEELEARLARMGTVKSIGTVVHRPTVPDARQSSADMDRGREREQLPVVPQPQPQATREVSPPGSRWESVWARRIGGADPI